LKKILAADIGGTNSRFAYFELLPDNTLSLSDTCWLKTVDAGSFLQLLEQLVAVDFPLMPGQSDAAVFAIAGPVEKGLFSAPPNISWSIDLASAAENMGLQRYLLINDFVAQAYACRSPIIVDARQVLPGTIVPDAALAVIGAGTGLGQAALIPNADNQFWAVPSEGGHSNFAFESQEEYEYMKFLLDAFGSDYVETETVVSGKGLSLVHQFLTGEVLEPAKIAASVKRESRTFRWMARFYGRVCRLYALQVLARGGVYITGGVAARIPELVLHAEFKKEFYKSTTMNHVLKQIPVYLNSNEDSGLWGAAVVGQQLLNTSASQRGGAA
jgi:glucokinase